MPRSKTDFTWTPELEAELAQLWQSGEKAITIAALFGTTRNSIIGKLNRLNLLGQKRPWQAGPREQLKAKPKTPRKRPSKPAPVVQEAVVMIAAPIAPPKPQPAPVVPPEGLPLLELREGHCRYPKGGAKARPTLFCGQPVLPNTSWCRECRKIVFIGKPEGRGLFITKGKAA